MIRVFTNKRLQPIAQNVGAGLPATLGISEIKEGAS
jgi:hypothetical protein